MKNQLAIFCGGSSGLGNSAALRFIKQGWKVINIDLAPSPQLDAAGATTYSCDLSNYKEASKTFAKIFTLEAKAPDVLINTVRYRSKNENLSLDQELKKATAIGLDTYYFSTLIVSEYVKENGGECSIVNFSSILSSLVTEGEVTSYQMIKAAIEQMTRTIAVKYGPYGIRANSVRPGLISKNPEKYLHNPSERFRKIASYTPMRRVGTPDDITEVLLFLASPASSFITGQEITIDGGLSLRDQCDCMF